MHELPEGLAQSLRSWRGSVSSNNRRPGPADLESHGNVNGTKDSDDHAERDVEHTLSPADSSLVLHPTASNHAVKHGTKEKGHHHSIHHSHKSNPHPHHHPHHHHHRQESAHQSDPQIGHEAQPPHTSASATKQSVYTAPTIDDPDPAADRIATQDSQPLSDDDFYRLIGMRQPTSRGQNPKELALRHGLYGQIHHEMEYVQAKYRVFDVFTYIFLVLQLLLSAVFIILGSLRQVDTHIIIAILGAVSAVIGGLLAVMKGQGLPNRLRQTRDSLKNVVFEAEELYWDVEANRAVYFKDIIKLREDYLRVMMEARKNHPDTWNTITTDLAKGLEIDRNRKTGTTRETAHDVAAMAKV